MQIATIGYENDTLDTVLAKLEAAKVEILIDVRAVASSRRAGFSKTLLAASLQERGIAYVHLRALGTPKPGRDAARAGRVAEMREIYEQHLQAPEAQAELARAGVIAREKKAALLCYEADVGGCHRLIVAERLRRSAGFEIENL